MVYYTLFRVILIFFALNRIHGSVQRLPLFTDVVRIVTWNLNGIRAAIRKGLDDFLSSIDADIWMFQEVRALPEQIPKDWSFPNGFESIWHPAQKKGYSGVCTISKIEMQEIDRGINARNDPDDDEGRLLLTKHGDLILANTYLPSGSARSERQIWKEEWMADYLQWAQQFVELETPVILAGDLNICHTEDDIWNPAGNKKNSGFLPQERKWFSDLLASGWSDVFREYRGPGKGPYSWWSNRGRARIEDKGWRIDYLLANKAASEKVKHVEIVRDGGLVVSDHAPVVLDIEI